MKCWNQGLAQSEQGKEWIVAEHTATCRACNGPLTTTKQTMYGAQCIGAEALT